MRHRRRRSIFDPHREQIEKWCSLGVTVPDMIKMLGGGYSEQALYTFIRNNGLRESWKVVYAARNKCKNCEYCEQIINLNNMKQLVCMKSKRVIRQSVVYSPVWCEKEKVWQKQEEKA